MDIFGVYALIVSHCVAFAVGIFAARPLRRLWIIVRNGDRIG